MKLLASLIPLAAAPLLIAAAPAAAAPGADAPGPVPPQDNQALAHDVLSEMVAIRSTHEVGTAAVAEVVVRHLKAGGFTDKDIVVVADPKYPHQVNVVVRLKGKGKARPILWNGHMDIVEAKPEDWSVPPFQLTEKDGYYYGRGTSDMKQDDAAMLASLVRLKQEGFVPERDIIIAFTADEEVGLEQDGPAYLLRDHRDLIDAEYAIDTDGANGELQNGKRVALDVETAEKTYVTLKLEVTNRGGHSSEPRPDNAIYTLAAGLGRLAAWQYPFKTNASTRLYFQREAALQTGQIKDDMLAVSGPTPDPAAAARLARDPGLNSILHSTCVATMLSAGHQENALAQRADATVQCRVMPDETPEQTRQTIEQVVADPQIKVTLPQAVVSGPETVPSPAVLAKVQKVTDSMWQGVTVIPAMGAGASDGLFFRGGGIPTYCINGVFEDESRMHGRDERVGVRAFYESVEFTYRLMKETSRAQ
ncbi:M20/M25/M40 family metallo-hydrolase [Caulobacter sp. KR2-114]|uniref:M20/M25/M40 family metallo-hydrolase n=1 Tax=Caulobacter sp. KR2-114 TaxID=3400912 RepID=UPI003C052C61